MCGIAGIYDKHGANAEGEAPVLETMLNLMRYRGPDDRGAVNLGELLLGHLRLSILDLSPRGRQPLTIEDGRFWISYNGEVYNYIELRSELEALGVRFFSDTDTEVILQAYSQWGLDCFRRFNGMWAMAIWDSHRRELVFCRDRVGIKPLYWFLHGDRLVFASEIKAILAYMTAHSINIELDMNAVTAFLNTGMVDGLENAMVKGVRRFKPGHLMVVREGTIKEYRSYWDLPSTALALRDEWIGREETELAEELYHLIGDAVTKHSRSDVPVGVCLSGGLDSSAVAGFANQVIPGIKTFTSWFAEGEEYNELPHADRVVRAFDLTSFPVEVDGGRLLAKVGDLLWHLDEPALGPGTYPMWHVMEAAAKEVTVVMDGQGGDELFAGYDFYAPHFLYSRLLAGDREAVDNTLSGYLRNYGPAKMESLRQQSDDLMQQNPAAGIPQLFPSHLDNFLYHELTFSRLPALLRYEDRCSMAFSIESRVPLLDYRLIEFAFGLEEGRKSGPGWSKYLMRRSLEKFLPPEVTWRLDKKGYPTPFGIWADGILKTAIREIVAHPKGLVGSLVGSQNLLSFFQAWDRGRKDEWTLWRFFCLEAWNQTYPARLKREVDQSLSVIRNRVVETESKKREPTTIGL